MNDNCLFQVFFYKFLVTVNHCMHQNNAFFNGVMHQNGVICVGGCQGCTN